MLTSSRLYAKEFTFEVGGNSHKNINIPLPFCWSSVTPPLSSLKTIKNLLSTRKFKHVRHLHWPRALYLPRADVQNIFWFINSELVRTLYSVWLLSNLSWKQKYIIIIVYLWSHTFNEQGCDFTIFYGVGWSTFKV